MDRILVINVGSTSTKLAEFEEGKLCWSEGVSHDAESLSVFEKAYDQVEMRRSVITDILDRNHCRFERLTAVATRAPLYPKPVEAGAYAVNDSMVDDIMNRPAVFHPGNLAILYVREIADKYGIPAIAFDSASENERWEVTKVTGLPEIRRSGKTHTLNMREVAMEYCEQNGIDYAQSTFVVAHMGGGTTLDLHYHGKVIDGISDDFGPFSPTRMGAIPGYELVRLVQQWKGTPEALLKKLQRESGLFAYFGTTDLREVEKLAKKDDNAKLVLDAMCLNIAKGIGSLSIVVDGKVDAIILTGGMAYSDFVTGKIREKVSFLAPVVVVPGENEMKAIANGAMRAIRNKAIHEYASVLSQS